MRLRLCGGSWYVGHREFWPSGQRMKRWYSQRRGRRRRHPDSVEVPMDHGSEEEDEAGAGEVSGAKGAGAESESGEREGEGSSEGEAELGGEEGEDSREGEEEEGSEAEEELGTEGRAVTVGAAAATAGGGGRKRGREVEEADVEEEDRRVRDVRKRRGNADCGKRPRSGVWRPWSGPGRAWASRGG